MPKYLDIDGLRTLWAQITNKISHESNATAEALEGKADLVEGKIPASQLPSYVDDVLEHANKASFPATGEAGKIYLDLATNLTYRWSGTAYTEISPSLALGTTSSTAYRGDYGAAAYKHAVTNKGIAKTSGLYKITTNAEGHVTAATAVVKADITGLGIPAQDTTYGNATTTAAGLMSSTDKTKLNSINLSALVKSVNGITPDSNGNVVIEVGGGTVSGDYLPLSGGTLTGNLYGTNATFNKVNMGSGSAIVGDSAWVNLAFNTTDGKNRGSIMLTDKNTIHFNIRTDGATYADRYKLPDATANKTNDDWYNILTSKYAVTIPQGGTGATTPEAARTALGITPANIGALALSGGTLTDTLYCQSTGGMIGLAIGTASKPENVSIISVGDGTEFNRFSFRQYGANGNRENFNLPNTTTPAQNVNYSILTSKNPVTIAQGGTGATDAATACENLGALPLTGGTLSGWLTAPRFVVQSNDGYPAISYNNTDGNQVGGLLFNASTHRFYVSQKATDTNYNENYILPTVATGLTANKTYNFITSKGGTMAGTLSSTKASQAYTIGTSAKPTLTTISMGTNDPGTRMYFTHYDQNSSYYDNFVLPGTKDLTKNGNYWILTTKSPVTVAQGGTGATTASEALENLGALPLAGGTMTGKLYLANGSGVYGTDTGWTSISFRGADEKIRCTLMLTNENCFHVNQQETGATYAERYKLPIVTTGLTKDVWYAILTSKNAVTIAQGGTGATTAATACANLGAVKKSGDTMTGSLNIQTAYAINIGTADVSAWNRIAYSNDGTNNRLIFHQRGQNGKYEYFNMPNTSNPSSDTHYSILTTKSAVTVAQGGTGATTATGARENLLIKVSATAPSSPATGTIWVDIS